MTDSFAFHAGSTPLLISIPHDGRELLEHMSEHMTPAGLDLPDTDWHVEKLYEFAKELGASVLVARYSRYVIDLNRAASDDELYPGQLSTGLCPGKTFTGHDIYCNGMWVDAQETAHRVAQCWRPYHDKIASVLGELRRRHGYALLWDAHSIQSSVPRLFDGQLPELNIGTFNGQSTRGDIADAVFAAARDSDYEAVLNGRFKGGYITRHYGRPDTDVHAIQLEISQRAYMDELSRTFDPNRADYLRATLGNMLDAYLKTAKEQVA